MKHLATYLQAVGAVFAVGAGACISLFWALAVAAVMAILFGIALELGTRAPKAAGKDAE